MLHVTSIVSWWRPNGPSHNWIVATFGLLHS